MKRFFYHLFSVMLISLVLFVSCSDVKIIPAEPQNVTAIASDPCCIDVSWDAVYGATSYVVYYRLSSEYGEEKSKKIETESTYIRIEELIGEKTYDFWVIAKNSTGESDRSDVVSAKSYFPTPTKPKNMTVTASGFCCMDVSWDAVDSATCYIVYYRLSSEDNDENLQKIETEKTFIKIENLIGDKTYDFWVTAKNSTGESDKSNVVSAFSYFPTPTEPQNVKATASAFRCINVSWNAVDCATSYVLYYCLSADDSEENLQKIETEKTFIKIENLIGDKTYDFWVTAKNSTGESDKSNVVSAFSYFPTPTEPQNVKATASAFRCINVSWNAVDCATSYVLYYCLSADDSEENLQKIETEKTFIKIENLIDDEIYDFWVIAKNSTGESDRSNIVSAKSCLPAPTALYAYAQGTGCARVSWSLVNGANSYELYAEERDSSGRLKEKTLLKTTSTTNIVLRLTSGQRYRFYVKAVRGTKTSGYSLGSGWIIIH